MSSMSLDYMVGFFDSRSSMSAELIRRKNKDGRIKYTVIYCFMVNCINKQVLVDIQKKLGFGKIQVSSVIKQAKYFRLRFRVDEILPVLSIINDKLIVKKKNAEILTKLLSEKLDEKQKIKLVEEIQLLNRGYK